MVAVTIRVIADSDRRAFTKCLPGPAPAPDAGGGPFRTSMASSESIRVTVTVRVTQARADSDAEPAACARHGNYSSELAQTLSPSQIVARAALDTNPAETRRRIIFSDSEGASAVGVWPSESQQGNSKLTRNYMVLAGQLETPGPAHGVPAVITAAHDS